MIEIDRIEDSFRVNASDDGVWVAFRFRDIAGTLRQSTISASAIQALTAMLTEGQQALIDHLMVSGPPSIGVDLITGPTRGETYMP